MTLLDTQPAVELDPTPGVDPKGALLKRVLDLLEREGVPYCIMHGYGTFPDRVDRDVDMLVPHEHLPRRIADVLRNAQAELNARVVQWFVDRAHFIVLSTIAADGTPVMLQLHIGTDYDIENRMIYDGNDVIRTRRKHPRGFWIPAAHVEFVCVLCNRVSKEKIEERHAKQLSGLWSQDRERGAHEMFKWFGSDSARMIADAAESGDWNVVQRKLPALRREMLRTAAMKQPMSYLGRVVGTQVRRIKRWTNPESGLHVVFLGPDGVGKSTVIETVQNRVADAFLLVNYKTFAGSLLANKPKASPHALPPRSKGASLLKAAWWLWCYTVGWAKATHPVKARGGLAINHRYLVDAIVDPKRYRYSGPIELLWAIWSVVPKPDLIVCLDAPATVIWERKKETTLEETIRQRDAYRALAEKLPNAKIVDTSQSPEKTIAEVTELILGMMAERNAKRFKGA